MGENSFSNCLYDGNTGTIEVHRTDGSSEVMDFYCGQEITNLAVELVRFKEGAVSLQGIYTMMLQMGAVPTKHF